MAAGAFSWSRYAVARITRIYPLFLLGLSLAIIVWWFTDHLSGEPSTRPWPQLVSSLLSLQIFTSTFPNFEPSWRLSNEMLYYFAWPLVLVLLCGRNHGKALSFSMAAAFLSAVRIMVSWNVFHRFDQSAFVHCLWTVTVLYPLWLSGAWLGAKWNSQSMRVSRSLWLCAIPLCALSALLLVALKFQDGPACVRDMVGLSSIPGIVLFLAGAHHARLGSHEWTRRVSRWLGQFSYPSYVLHFQLMLLLDRLLVNNLGTAANASPVVRSLTLFIPVTLLMAAIGQWMERGAMAWRAGMLQRLSTTAPPR